VDRSTSSLQNYGPNSLVLLRPDGSIAAIQTAQGFLITYHVSIDAQTRVYQQIPTDEKAKRGSEVSRLNAELARYGQGEAQLRFRMVFRVEAGISFALALDDELVVATKKPAAIQCIRWETSDSHNQTSTEHLARLPWMQRRDAVSKIIYDRAMGLYIWITHDGAAFAVQKLTEPAPRTENQGRLFRGHQLHTPTSVDTQAKTAAVNARFSLLAVGCVNGSIQVYAARDYAGSLPLSHSLISPVSQSTSGPLHCIKFSPDGYCLFAGYEKGWVMWSVYGRLGGSSFAADREVAKENDESWLLGVKNAEWSNGGSQILLTAPQDARIWALSLARSAMTGCLVPPNTARMLLLTDSDVRIYRGHDASDIISIATDPSQWLHVQIPPAFLTRQRPLRSTVISADGRYVAVAGRRGLAHYSISSGRWKTFNDLRAENSFVVRGGMCWYQHVLIAAVETSIAYEVGIQICKSRKLMYVDPTVFARKRT
jgi:RAB6A-GEF complex partner protein 1